jgi:dTDP-glucose 4,6-dehydratase
VFVVNLDKLTYAGSLDNLVDLPGNGNYQFVKADICDQNSVTSVMRTYEIDAIVHFAAETHVDRSIHGPAEFITTNILGTFSLLESARNVWLTDQKPIEKKVRFHHISTDEVFGTLEPDDPPFSETTPYSPNSPYAASKAGSDHLVRSYYHTYGLPVTVTNCSNNYGPFQFPEKLIPLMIYNALEGKPLPIYGDGLQIRDWLYVEDHCEAIWKVLQFGKAGETYNIGGNNQHTNLEIVKELCRILDEIKADSPYIPHWNLHKYITDRPGHDRRYAMNIARITRELGWQPKNDLWIGLRKTVEWYLENGEWKNSIFEQQQYKDWVETNYSNRGKQ